MISRQNRILGYIRTHSKVATRDILAFLKKEEEHISQATILRDIEELLHEKLIKKTVKVVVCIMKSVCLIVLYYP